jgi:hypothetical protein
MLRGENLADRRERSSVFPVGEGLLRLCVDVGAVKLREWDSKGAFCHSIVMNISCTQISSSCRSATRTVSPSHMRGGGPLNLPHDSYCQNKSA